jgi:hypothetical protein
MLSGSSPGTRMAHFVIPAKAGIQFFFRSHSAINLDSRLRGHDEFCAVQSDIAC